MSKFAIMVLDINNLKKINDKCGHSYGNILIIDACKIICKVFNHSPVYRIGGDEFVVILENEDYDNYNALIDNFDKVIKEHNGAASSEGKISIAFGTAFYDSEKDLVFADVFKRADDAMYKKKAEMKEVINNIL